MLEMCRLSDGGGAWALLDLRGSVLGGVRVACRAPVGCGGRCCEVWRCLSWGGAGDELVVEAERCFVGVEEWC